MSGPLRRPVRIANCSGFFGDRRSAAREMVEGGPIDVLTGDWLAELTMLILARTQARRPDGGYASSFLAMMEEVLGTCLERGIRVVSNAGGLDPAGCADAVRALAAKLGLDATVAHVEGDDLRGRHFSDVEGGAEILTANAYLGGRGIADGLSAGADVVVTGRVTDAALVVGPAAWWHGWSWDAWDALAGAVVAGHVIECGAQATGGNYSFFTEVPGLEHPGFPLAEVDADGSSVITKHPGTGGRVDVGTVTAQLLYEIAGPSYANPDVVARFDTITLREEEPDRVRITGVRGTPPPPDLKVALNYVGGHRNSVTFVFTGLDIAAKAALAERSLWEAIPGGRAAFDTVDVSLSGPGLRGGDPSSNDEALAYLRVTVTSADPKVVGRKFSNAATELALANYPGFFSTSPPGDSSPFGVYWPTAVPRETVDEVLVVDGQRRPVARPPSTAPLPVDVEAPGPDGAPDPDAETVLTPLGSVVGARSGDKGGNANVGVWARTDDAYAWLVRELTTARFRQLVPEAGTLEVRRFELANLRALNFVVVGLLGRGVAASTRTDAQAKGLGEYLRARLVPVPTRLLSG
ncbi:MAG: acyclic terpene utilization AtuA family protein [Acidimicrobiales bacterium]